MFKLNQLNVIYSFWTHSDDVISVQDLTNWFSKQNLSYQVVDSPIDTARYYTIVDAGGEPILLLGFHQSTPEPTGEDKEESSSKAASEKERTAQRSFLTSKYHYDILFAPTGGIHRVIASLHLLYALSSLRKGAVLDLKAQRIISSSQLKKILERSSITPEDHISLQFVIDRENGISWLHSHGMEKFDLPNLETFDLAEENLLDTIQLFNDLALSMIEGHAPLPNAPIDLPGGKITLMFSHDVRQFLSETYGTMFKEHKGASYSVIEFEEAGDINQAVSGYFTAKYFGPQSTPLSDPEEIKRALTPKTLAIKEVVFFLCLTIDSSEYGKGNLWLQATDFNDELIKGQILVSGLSNKKLGKGDTIEFSFDEIRHLYVTKENKLLSPKELHLLLNTSN